APTERERISGRELKFEAAVITICATVIHALLGALLLASVASVMITLLYPGIGEILRHFLHYSWMHYTHWYDRQTLKPIGRWDAFILHVRDLQLIHGFHVSIDGRHQEDGFVTIQFHATEDPYNVVATRSVPVRAIMQKNMNPFEGDNVNINITSWRSILVVNIMYQQQNGAQPQRVAGGLWDPWTGRLLRKCFSNATICDPDPGQGGKMKLWDFQDLIDSDGKPKEGCYVEARVNLSPCNGLLSLQMTHLGPRPVLEERDDPSDQPSKESVQGPGAS
ncbi:crtp1, partial [Symbiodinium pilosum]